MIRRPPHDIDPWLVAGRPPRLSSMIRVEFCMGAGESIPIDFVTARLVKCEIGKNSGQRWHLYGDAYFAMEAQQRPQLMTLVVSATYIRRTSVVERTNNTNWDYSLNSFIFMGSGGPDAARLDTLRSQIEGLAEPPLDRAVAAAYAKGASVAIVDLRKPRFPIVGSGVIVTEGGAIATNRHVIEGIVGKKTPAEAPNEIGVLLWVKGSDDLVRPLLTDVHGFNVVAGMTRDGKLRPDDVSDLGFIHLGFEGMPCANFLESPSSLVPGQGLLASGYPSGDTHIIEGDEIKQRMPFVHSGFISALRSEIGGTIEQLVCDLPVIPGSSGSPVFLDTTGELAGIVSHSLPFNAPVSGSGESRPEGRPLAASVCGPSSLVIPISTIKRALDATLVRTSGVKPRDSWSNVKEAFDSGNRRVPRPTEGGGS